LVVAPPRVHSEPSASQSRRLRPLTLRHKCLAAWKTAGRETGGEKRETDPEAGVGTNLRKKGKIDASYCF
jgi:hypothetical protein